MNLSSLLPTKKVTAFTLGAAVALVLFWVLGPENLDLIKEPDLVIGAAVALIFGFVFAWIIPEGTWARVGRHQDKAGDVELPDTDDLDDDIGH